MMNGVVAPRYTHWHRLDECEQGPGREGKYSAHALVYKLESYNEFLADELFEYDGWEVSGGADMRVLACVDMASEGELPTRDEWYEMNA